MKIMMLTECHSMVDHLRLLREFMLCHASFMSLSTFDTLPISVHISACKVLPTSPLSEDVPLNPCHSIRSSSPLKSRSMVVSASSSRLPRIALSRNEFRTRCVIASRLLRSFSVICLMPSATIFQCMAQCSPMKAGLTMPGIPSLIYLPTNLSVRDELGLRQSYCHCPDHSREYSSKKHQVRNKQPTVITHMAI